MVLGPALQARLVGEGLTVRLYLPFGTEWWPYTARRIGEKPANALFVVRALPPAHLPRRSIAQNRQE